MTRISGAGAPAAPDRASRAAPSRGFAVPDPPAPAAEGVFAAAAMSAGLLALQSDEAGASQDRAARRHGRGLLAALAGLQRAMLDGPVGPGSLAALADQLADIPQAADPRLRAVLHAIALRARVELARNDRGDPSRPDAAEK